jgi:hypothetical protein
MKPTLVSSRTISEINSMIRNSKSLKERYKISLYINIFFFVILLIGLFVLYKRYKNNSNENKQDTVRQFYDNVNKLYQQQSALQSHQHTNNSNNNIISHTQQSPVNSNKSLRFDELLPHPVNTFNGDIPTQPPPGMHQQSNHNLNYSQNSAITQNYNSSPSQNYNSTPNHYNSFTSQNYNSTPTQNYNSSPSQNIHNYQKSYSPSQNQNQNIGIRDLNDVSPTSTIIDNNLPHNSEKWNDMGFMAYNDNSDSGYESFI